MNEATKIELHCEKGLVTPPPQSGGLFLSTPYETIGSISPDVRLPWVTSEGHHAAPIRSICVQRMSASQVLKLRTMPKKQFQSRFALNQIEETVRLFDSFGSVYQTSEHLLDVLSGIGPPEDAMTEDYRTLIAYVGATWAKMVDAIEIDFDLPYGMELFTESRNIAQVAEKRLTLEIHPTDPQLPGFFLARWNDITAKLYYFSGDHLEAARYWDRSRDLIETHKVDFIKADVLSSRLRNQRELVRISTKNTSVEAIAQIEKEYEKKKTDEVKGEFDSLVEESQLKLQAFEIPANAADLGAIKKLQDQINDANWKDRGRLRGLANLYQNQDQFEKVRILATALRDELRLVQSCHAEAGKVWLSEGALLKLRETDPNAPPYDTTLASNSANLWKQVRDSEAWRRGVIFARQHLARLDKEVYFHASPNEDHSAKLWALYTGVEELINVIDSIQDRDEELCDRRPQFAVRDIEQHGWTVKFALDMLEELENLNDQQDHIVKAAWAERIASLGDRMQEECIQMVRSHRRVIRISTFKTSFAAHYDRAFKRVYRHFAKRIESEHNKATKLDLIRDAVLWVEESTCRDLLDAAAAANLAKPPRQAHESQRELSPDQQSPTTDEPSLTSDVQDPSPDEVDDPLLACDCLLPDDADSCDARTALNTSYKRFEEFATRSPQPPQSISPDLIERAMVAAQEHDCYFVRFAERSDLAMDVYIFNPNGEIHYKTLFSSHLSDPGVTANALRISLQRVLSHHEDFGDCASQLDGLSKTIGVSLLVPIMDLIEPGKRLFLIPTSFLWQVPFHIGQLSDGTMLYEKNPVFIAASLSALLDHGRMEVLNRKVTKKSFASFHSLDTPSNGVPVLLGSKIESVFRSKKKSFIQVKPWEQTSSRKRVNFDSLCHVFQFDPEVIYYGCHGLNLANEQGRHPVMSFTGAEGSPPDVTYPKSYLTPYDLAIAPMLSANVVAIFGACVTGQAADKDGGEVSGFLRASIASGAGACLLTYWPVLQSQVDAFVESLTKVLCDDHKSIGDAIQGTQDALNQKGAALWTKACFVCFV